MPGCERGGVHRAAPAAVAVVALALIAGARAQPAGPGSPDDREPMASADRDGGRAAAGRDPSLTVQLDAQRASVARARAQVEAKRDQQAVVRRRRVRLAYKLLRDAGSPLAVPPARRMAVARSRATARLLLARDRAELVQLGVEAALLAAAEARIARDRALAARVGAGGVTLRRPVRGTLVRRFGALVHERSRATLSRRGLDWETAAEADVVAPADGVVRYAGPLRGLDHGVIIDHGAVWTVIGKLDAPTVARGAEVRRGDLLGHPHHRRIYLEVRVPVGPGGVAIDPAPLLRDR